MSAELELADFSREALVYDLEKLKRPVSALQNLASTTSTSSTTGGNTSSSTS